MTELTQRAMQFIAPSGLIHHSADSCIHATLRSTGSHKKPIREIGLKRTESLRPVPLSGPVHAHAPAKVGPFCSQPGQLDRPKSPSARAHAYLPTCEIGFLRLGQGGILCTRRCWINVTI